MRDLFETFRLLGEVRQISPITQTFAEIYFASQPGLVFFTCSCILVAQATSYCSRDEKPGRSPRRCVFGDYVEHQSTQLASLGESTLMAIAHSFLLQLLSQKHMTIEDYQRFLRDAYDGFDFSPKYLVSSNMPNVSGWYYSSPS